MTGDRTRRRSASPRSEADDEAFDELALPYRSDPRVTAGLMFAAPGLKVGAKIFAMIVKDTLVVKLPRPRVDELVDAEIGVRFEPSPGRVMKEWLSVAGERSRWPGLAREAYVFVG